MSRKPMTYTVVDSFKEFFTSLFPQMNGGANLRE